MMDDYTSVCHSSVLLQKFRVGGAPLHTGAPHRPRPKSLILTAPHGRKEAEEEVPARSGAERTVEGSSANENGYIELQGPFSTKPEPQVVTLELGVARMTC